MKLASLWLYSLVNFLYLPQQLSPCPLAALKIVYLKAFIVCKVAPREWKTAPCQRAEGLGTMGNRSSRGENESLGLGDCGRFFEFTAPRVGIVEDIGTTTRIDGIIILANRCRRSGIAEAASQILS